MKPKSKQLYEERSDNYEFVTALTNYKTGMTFGQLWKGDSAAVQKELDHVFAKGGLKVTVLSYDMNKEDEEIEDKFLTPIRVKLHGTEIYTLMNSVATPNVASPSVTESLSLYLEDTNKLITVATDEN